MNSDISNETVGTYQDEWNGVEVTCVREGKGDGRWLISRYDKDFLLGRRSVFGSAILISIIIGWKILNEISEERVVIDIFQRWDRHVVPVNVWVEFRQEGGGLGGIATVR